MVKTGERYTKRMLLGLLTINLNLYYLTFNFKYSLQYSVNMLKDTIEKICGIPKANQVLLISGGEILQFDTKVFSYSSGTDTNPIFMFSTHQLQDLTMTAVFKDGKYI